MDMTKQVKFESTLTEGTRVWARWTTDGHCYHVAATVVRVNASSVRVSLDTFGLGKKLYAKGQEIVLNFSVTKQGKVNKKWSPNNGCFPFDVFNEHGRELRAIQCPKCTQDMRVEDASFARGGITTCSNRFCGKPFEVPPKARMGHHMVRCSGEAHNNPHIDHCGLCMPRWGWLELPEQFDSLEEYRDACSFASNPGVVHFEEYVVSKPPTYVFTALCGSSESTSNFTRFEKLVTCEHCKNKRAGSASKKESA